MGDVALKNAERPILKIKLTGEGDLERLEAIRKSAPKTRLVVDAREHSHQAPIPASMKKFRRVHMRLTSDPRKSANWATSIG